MQPPLWPQLLLQVILIAINAYFAATEIAVISLNEAVIRHQAEEGDKKAARLLHIVEQPTGFLSTIQIGITLAPSPPTTWPAACPSGSPPSMP